MRPLVAVILAGGGGTRFWPLSRRALPKQLLSFNGRGATLIEETVERVLPLVGGRWSRVYVVATEPLAAGIRKAMPRLRRDHLILEPVGRNTAAAVGLASAVISRKEGDPVQLVLPSDHFIPARDTLRFRRHLRAAAAFADREGWLVTLGIRPTRPETGYGYLKVGPKLGRPEGLAVHRVLKFNEKPSLPVARRYVASRGFLWNSGMFVWRTSTLLEELERHLPEHTRVVRGKRIEAGYRRLDSIPIDKGVMERSRRVAVVPSTFAWSDVGGYAGLHEVMGCDRDGNVARVRSLVSLDSRRLVAWSPGKVVAVLGLEDVIIADTQHALLVADRGRAQEVRRVVAELERRGLGEVL